jgi:hypothetical protein
MKTNDEQAIMNETASFAEAWSKGDAKAAASYYTELGRRPLHQSKSSAKRHKWKAISLRGCNR